MLSIGIVGLPNVGKSTLFNALTKKNVAASNYPFCTIDPNVGMVDVPDERLARIAPVAKSAKIVPTAIEFVDIAGLVKGAHQGEGLGNQFLANIRECDAICEVVRSFADANVMHVAGQVDPKEDQAVIGLELAMADLASVGKRLERAAKEAKSGDKEALKLKALLEKAYARLEQGLPARGTELAGDEEAKAFRALNLLSAKPIIYVLNSDQGQADKELGWDGEIVHLNVKQEQEIMALPPEEQAEFIRELGLDESGLNKLVKASYRLLDLITYFTAGPMETKAWTIKRGTKAPQAAGVIHTDFEQGFIRAEVIGWRDYLACGGETAAREKGLLKTEGKEYVMRDGDICHFLFSK